MASIRCAHCKGTHASVGEVRDCAYADFEAEAEARAEAEAEARAERFWEDRGADDGFDEWEARRGVIQFADAMAAACGR